MTAEASDPTISSTTRDAAQPRHLIHLDIQTWGERQAPGISWLFEQLLSLGEVGILAGRSNSGKGMASMEMGACIATGRPLFGRKGDGKPRHVLVVQMEDSPEELERRFVRLRELLSQDASWDEIDDKLLRQNLHFFVPNWQIDGGKSLTTLLPNLEATIKGVQKEGGEVGLIILDTLAALTEGDENSVESQRALWPASFKLRDLAKASVLIIHHLRKTAGGQKPAHVLDRLSFDALRGSTAIVAGARYVIQLEPLTAVEAIHLGLDEEKAQRGGYALIGLTKVVSGPKGDTLLLEQQEGVGAGFWLLHPNSDRLCALLHSTASAERLSQDEEVFASIVSGVTDSKELCTKHWPKQSLQDAAAKLKAVMNRLRNRHRWIHPGKSLELTEEGRRKKHQLDEGGAKGKVQAENLSDLRDLGLNA